MPKLEPIWQNLPFFFKSSVVEHLEYKDRCSMRKCSKSDQDLVDSTPNYLHDVAIHTCETYSLFSYSDNENTVFTVKYFKNQGEDDVKIEYSAAPRVFLPGKNEKRIFKNIKFLENVDPEADDLDFVLADFQICLKKLNCKKLIINDVIVKEYHPMAHPVRTMEFRERLLNLLTSSENSGVKKLKTKCLHLKWHQEQEEIVEILKIFDTKSLKRIEFSNRDATWQMNHVALLEQWKQADEVQLEVLSDLKVENLESFSEIQMHVRDMNEQDLWRVIQNFTSKNRHGSSFHFTYRRGEPDLQRILATFNVPPSDEPITAQTRLRSVLGGRFIHTQRFQMPSPDLVLVVMISEKEVMGTVCHVDQVDVEAKVERGLLR